MGWRSDAYRLGLPGRPRFVSLARFPRDTGSPSCGVRCGRHFGGVCWAGAWGAYRGLSKPYAVPSSLTVSRTREVPVEAAAGFRDTLQ